MSAIAKPALAVATCLILLVTVTPPSSRAAAPTCPPTDLWFVAVGGSASLDRFSPEGGLVSSVPVEESFGDIAWSADATTLYGVSFEEPLLSVVNPETGATASTVPITGLPVKASSFNALSALPNGNLLLGNGYETTIYELDPATGAATPFRASFPEGASLNGAAGDFLTLPDGDILALASNEAGGTIAYRIHPNNTVTEIGTLPAYEAWGAAQSGGSIYIGGYEGVIYRVDELPTAESDAPIAVTEVGSESGVEFYGASSIQDAGTCNIEPGTSYVVSKTQSASGSVSPGSVITYTIKAKNTGTVAYPAGSASFSDNLAGAVDDATYVPGSATASAGEVAVEGKEISWQGPLAAASKPGDEATISYSMRVNDPDLGDRLIKNTVTATAAGGSCASAGACETQVSVPAEGAGKSPATGVPTSATASSATATAAPQCVAPSAFSATSFSPSPVQGHTVPGVRVKLHASTPSKLSIVATLLFHEKGSPRRVDLGTYSLDVRPAGNLRVALPAKLRSVLPLTSKVRVALQIAATPESVAGPCSTSYQRHASVATKVVNVLVDRAAPVK